MDTYETEEIFHCGQNKDNYVIDQLFIHGEISTS